MPSKKLIAFWAFFDFLVLVAGVIAVVFAVVWHAPGNPLRNLVITDGYMTAGLAIGIAMLITVVVSIGAIVQPNHITRPLAVLNWVLILDAAGVVAVGTMVWWATLQERHIFQERFNDASNVTRLAIQDKLHCCGYFFNNETSIIVNSGFCATANNATACVGPITSFADSTLNDIFTSIYGFAAALGGLFLATLCVIKKRDETERFKKIDAKRGGRGFV